MSTATKTRITEALDSVRSLLSDLEVMSLSADDVVASHALVSAADFLCTQVVSQFAADGTYTDNGVKDMSTFLVLHAHARRGDGNARVKAAAVLRLLPTFLDASVAGTITPAHVQVLAAKITAARTAHAIRDEKFLVDTAIRFDVAGFTTVMDRWVTLVDDELSDPTDEDSRYAKRGIQIRQLFDGTYSINGTLDAEGGAIVEAAIAAAMATPSADDDRDLNQLRADALVDVCNESLHNDDRPITTGQRPQVSITIDSTDGTARTPNNWYVSSMVRDMMLCDCTITAIKSCEGVVFDVGTPETQIPIRNRKAVVARDTGCRFPGCCRPARWSEIHHIQERENGGCHQLENLVLMCRFHHRYVHRQSVKLFWAADNITLVAQMRNGTTLHGPPPPTTHTAHWN
jgi:hypothetical protein